MTEAEIQEINMDAETYLIRRFGAGLLDLNDIRTVCKQLRERVTFNSASQTLADAVLAFWIAEGRVIPASYMQNESTCKAMNKLLSEYERAKDIK
jgi:hypothetical protein